MKKIVLLLSLITNCFSYPLNERLHFSPNLDGVKDEILLEFKIKEESLKEWKFLIYEKQGEAYKLIREYRSVDVKEIHKMTGRKFFKRVFSVKQPVEVPKGITWDGFSKTPLGQEKYEMKKMADGVYYYRIVAMDESENKSSSPLIPIRIDTIVPDLSLNMKEDIFSPNKDGNKDKLFYKLQIAQLDPRDTIHIDILNDANAVVITKSIQGKVIEGEEHDLSWDGLAEDGGTAPEGKYEIKARAFDPAGNQLELPLAQFELVRTIEDLKITANAKAFSPDGNGYLDLLTFTLEASSQRHLDTYYVVFFDEQGNLVNQVTGREKIPELLTFEGLDEEGESLPDGTYTTYLRADYFSGNKPESEGVPFIIDTKPPSLSVQIQNRDNVFLPKSQENNQLKITQAASDLRGDETFTGVIFDEDGNQVKVEDFGNAVPEVYIWDGVQGNGSLQPGIFVYTLYGQDSLGNKDEVSSESFKLIDELATFYVKSDLPAISPNGDDYKDRVVFKIGGKQSSKNRVQQQSIMILKDSTKLIELTSSEFESSYVWDGRDQAGKLLPDYVYNYVFKAELEGGEVFQTEPKPLIIDTVPIEVSLVAEGLSFSPNGDGKKEKLVITQKKKPSLLANDQDKVQLEIRDVAGKVYRQLLWEGANIPTPVSWGGSDQLKNEVPEGSYVYSLQAEDLAGNRSVFELSPIALSRNYEKVDFSLSETYYSPNNQVVPNPIFKPLIEKKEGFLAYRYVAISEEDVETLLYEHGNKPGWEKEMVFKGVDLKGKSLDPGLYRTLIQARYESGNEPTSLERDLVIDPKGPEIEIHTRPKYFSPDGDGADERLNLNVLVKDPSGIKKAELLAFRMVEFDKKGKPFKQTLKNYMENAKPFKRWSLNEDENQMSWDGKGDDGSLVESANDYLLFARAMDNAGNTSIKKHLITVDVFVERLADGRYKIIINSIHFKYNSDKMLGNYRKTIDRLSTVLHKFKNYQIEVAGHTDSRGAETYNQKLSERRAASVYKYLIKKDIAKGRMDVIGKGEKELLIKPEKSENDYRKNRRVEFYLRKN